MAAAQATVAPPVSWRRLLVVDVVLAVALSVMAVVDTARHPGVVHPWSELFAVVAVGSLALRSRAPLLMCAVAAAGLVGYALLPASGTPLWSFLGVLVLGFFAGAELDGRRALAGVGLLLVGCYVLQLSSTDRGDPSDNSFSEVWISPLVILGAPFAGGRVLRRSRRQNAELKRLSEELRAERQKREAEAAEAERRRIARELHDVISHSVSLMVVQAGAAEQLLNGDGAAREAVHAVRETGKEALAELRRQLAVLREGEAGPSTALPGLAEIPALVERSGGRFIVEGAKPGDVPAGLALTVYRVVQEGLTNARRHAVGSAVSVRLGYENAWMDVTVEDDGGGARSSEGSGQGLQGVRERVEMYDGQLDAGPRGDRPGWRLHARLPVTGRALS
jgi:signal transduction histidine kinase